MRAARTIKRRTPSDSDTTELIAAQYRRARSIELASRESRKEDHLLVDTIEDCVSDAQRLKYMAAISKRSSAERNIAMVMRLALLKTSALELRAADILSEGGRGPKFSPEMSASQQPVESDSM